MILLKKTNNTQTFYVTKSYGVEAAQIPVGSYTKQEADALFQPKGNYPTEEEIQEMIDTTLDENVYPKIEEESQERRNGDALTLLAAKGYTDSKLLEYYDKTEVDELLETKQDVLVSGVNIKTLNGESLLGEGNIDITVNVENFYTKDEVDEKVSNLESEISTKQDELISGTTIKTINGESLLGEGNITTPNPDDFYTKTESDSKYQPIGDYVDNTTFEASQKAQDDKVDNLSTNLTNSIEQAKNDAIRQSKNYTDEKISEIPVDTFATKDELEDKADKTEVSSLTDRVEELEESKADLIYVDDELDKKADKTDLDDYATKEYVDEAISEVDAYTKSEADAKFGTLEEQKSLRNDVEQALGEIAELGADKVDKTGLKTINGESLLGEGDIEIEGGAKVYVVYTNNASNEEVAKDLFQSLFNNKAREDRLILDYSSLGNTELKVSSYPSIESGNAILYVASGRAQYYGSYDNGVKVVYKTYTLDRNGKFTDITGTLSVKENFSLMGSDYIKYAPTSSNGGVSTEAVVLPVSESSEESNGLATAYDVKQYVDSHSSGGSNIYKLSISSSDEAKANNLVIYNKLLAGEDIIVTFTDGNGHNITITRYKLSGTTFYMWYQSSNVASSESTNQSRIGSSYYVGSGGYLYDDGRFTYGDAAFSLSFGFGADYFKGNAANYSNPLSIKQTSIEDATELKQGLADAYDVKQYVDSHSGGKSIYALDDEATPVGELVDGFFDIVDSGKLYEYIFLVRWVGDRQSTRDDLYVVNRIIKISDDEYQLSINDPRKINSYLNSSSYNPCWMNISLTRGRAFIGYTTSDDFALYKNSNTISGRGSYIDPWTVKTTTFDTVTQDTDGFATAFETKQYIDSHSGGGGSDIYVVDYFDTEANLKVREKLINKEALSLVYKDNAKQYWPIVKIDYNFGNDSILLFYERYTVTTTTSTSYMETRAMQNYIKINSDGSISQNYGQNNINLFKFDTNTFAGLADYNPLRVKTTTLEETTQDSDGFATAYNVKEYIDSHSSGGSSSILLHSGDTVADLYTQLKAGEHPTIYVDDYSRPVLMTYYDVTGYADTVILYGYKSESSVTYSDSTTLLECRITAAGKVSTSNLKVNILTAAERTKISNIPTKYVTDITQNGGHITVNNASGSETVIDFCTINGQSIFGQNDLKVASNEKVAELEAKIAQLEATIGTLNQRLTTLIGE